MRLGEGVWGKDVLVATSHMLLKYVCGGRCGWSATAEFELGKLMSKTHSVRDMVHACTDLEYINPTPLSIVMGHPPTS